MITKVAFVGFPTQDPEGAKRFFGELLGLPLANDYQGKWFEYDTPEGKSLAIDGYSPEGSHCYLALETDDIAAEVSKLKENGVKVLVDVMDNKVCKMAMVEGPGGHAVMLHEIAPDRKQSS